jgi:hypothetical protein
MPEIGPPQQPSNYYIQPSKSLDADTTKWLLRFDDQLEYLYHDMKGEVEFITSRGREWNLKGERKLNDKGIIFIISALRDTTSKFAMMSNIDKEQAYKIAHETCDYIAIGLFLQQRDFEMKTTAFYTVMPKVRNIIELAILRAVAGEERKLHHTSETVSRIYSTGEEQKKSGFGLSSLNIFKRS